MIDVVETMDEADIFELAWVRGSHLIRPLTKIIFAIRNKQGFIVCGDSGLGKSSLAIHAKMEMIKQATERRECDSTKTHNPLLYISLENKSKPRDVILDLLECMGIPEESIPVRERTERQLRKLLFKQIALCGVRAIIFDEFQHLLRRRNASVNSDVGDFIKVLMTQTGISIGLFGMEEGTKLLPLDRQIKTRWIRPAVLHPLKLDSNGEPEYFQWFLSELLKLYPRKTKDFASRENALRFLMASGGNLRELKKILTPLIRDTKHMPSKIITMKDAKKVYETINGEDDDCVVYRARNGRKICPFTSNIDLIERYLKDDNGF
jgi:hypothetical protein